MSRKKKIKIIKKYDENCKYILLGSILTIPFTFLGTYIFFISRDLFDKILGLGCIFIVSLSFLILLLDSREFYIEVDKNAN